MKQSFDEFIKQTGLELNKQQMEAVTQTDGHVLLLAVPGSGKTVSLVTRIGYMVMCCGIDPSSILTLTYTVAAANDMRQRYAVLFGADQASRLEFRTINGICSKIIGRAADRYGKEPFRLISDEKETAPLLASIYRDIEGKTATESDIKSLRSYIAYIKNMMLDPKEERSFDEKNEYSIAAVRKAYDKALRAAGCMDYDDQMRYALNMLKADPGLLKYYHNMYRYICVDEAQDTSKIQHEIIRLLAEGSGNLFMVGDEDQSIYGFRAAWPEALLEFDRQYEDARLLLMETNYRSSVDIVEAADAFIAKNAKRHAKHMRAASDRREPIEAIRVSGRSQYELIADIAGEEADGTRAVLYRDNESVVPLVDILERRGISYSIKGADLTFFTSRILNDIRAIAALSENGRDEAAFMEVYYKISTFLTKADAEKACRTAYKTGDSILDAALSMQGLSMSALKGCRTAKNMLAGIKAASASEAMDIIRYELGYDKYLERSKMKKNKLRALRAIADNEDSLEGLILRLDELREMLREGSSHETPRLILSTIHASKGLEYDTVYIMDACEGILPETAERNIMPWDKEAKIQYEEERRLFYVGMTRARNKLYLLTYPGKHGFADEIFARIAQKAAAHKDGGVRTLNSADKESENSVFFDNSVLVPALEQIDTESIEFANFFRRFTPGIFVEHKKYGRGLVVSNDGVKLTVSFESDSREFSLAAVFGKDILSLG